MLGVHPGGLYHSSRVIRAQAVKVNGVFSYSRQPVLDFVGPEALVSFEEKGKTLELGAVSLVSGANRLCQLGNAIRLEGVKRDQQVVVCVVEPGRLARRLRFVFR